MAVFAWVEIILSWTGSATFWGDGFELAVDDVC